MSDQEEHGHMAFSHPVTPFEHYSVQDAITRGWGHGGVVTTPTPQGACTWGRVAEPESHACCPLCKIRVCL